MNTEPTDNLEEFIHARLAELPEREAPADLSANVLAFLAAQEQLPWYKQPWSQWPRLWQNLFLGLLLAATTALAWLVSPVANSLSLPSLMARLASLGWVFDFVSALFSSLFLLLNNSSWEFWAGAGAVCAGMYFACLSAGVALYRVATPASGSRL